MFFCFCETNEVTGKIKSLFKFNFLSSKYWVNINFMKVQFITQINQFITTWCGHSLVNELKIKNQPNYHNQKCINDKDLQIVTDKYNRICNSLLRSL